MLKSDKRGISILIGYILLISMSIGLSVLVYNWLEHYVPDGDVITCPEETSLSIRNINCDSVTTNLSFDVRNNGLFDVDGFEVKVSDRDSRSGIYSLGSSSGPLKAGETVAWPGPPANSIIYTDYVFGEGDGSIESSLTLLEIIPYRLDGAGEKHTCRSITSKLNCNLRDELCIGGRDEDNDGLYDCFDYDCRYSKYCIGGPIQTDGALSSNHLPDIYNHLFAYYTFDDEKVADGDLIKDYSDNVRDAEVEGVLTWVSGGGYVDNGYQLKRNEGCIKLFNQADADLLGESFTISMWILADASSANTAPNANLLSRTNDWLVEFTQNKPLPHSGFVDFDGDGDSTDEYDLLNSLQEDEWTHFTFVWDFLNNEFKTYRNGVFVSSPDTLYNPPMNPNTNIALGCSGGNNGGDNSVHSNSGTDFTGSIDEVIVFNMAFDEDQVEDLYNYYEG